MKVKVKKLSEHAVMPFKAYATDSGFDLFALDQVIISPFQKVAVGTGIAFEIPVGYEIQIRPKSGVSSKTPLNVIVGTVDSGYIGEVSIIVQNVSSERYEIPRGYKLAQAVFQKLPDIELVEATELNSGDRGANGFGSTGV